MLGMVFVQVYKPVAMPKVSIHETSYGQLLQSLTRVNKDVEKKNRYIPHWNI